MYNTLYKNLNLISYSSGFFELLLFILLVPSFIEIANNTNILTNLLIFLFVLFALDCGLTLIKGGNEFIGVSVLLVYSSVFPILLTFYVIFTDIRS